MAIHSALDAVLAALTALALTDLEAVYLGETHAWDRLHHPPLNPDVPALLSVTEAGTWAHVRRVLLNQYPPAHPVTVVAGQGEAAPALVPLTVAALAAEAVPAAGWHLLYIPPLPEAASFERFQQTIAHLRSPEGCPWDRKQTHQSLRPYLLEETYEVLDALDAGDSDALREELGDLLLQIVLHSQVAVDAGTFRMADIVATINEKIIRRHPHVWGQVEVDDENDVKVNWDRLKQAEKNEKSGQRQSRLDGVARTLPALTQAFSYQDRAARVHFDWETIDPVIAKIREELDEVLTAVEPDSQAHEVGDLLFAVVNLARWLEIDPESALRAANARFYRRFRYIEQQADAQGRSVEALSLTEMDALWDDAKANGL